MAIATLQGPVGPISGTLHGITYVSWNGKQILRRKARPARRSPGQSIQPQRLRQAAAYWRAVLRDPARKAVYFSLPHVPGLGPYQFCIRDFCRPPALEAIDASGYSGKAGEALQILATDDTKVAEVRVRIAGMDGTVWEEGSATADGGPDRWVYRATRDIPPGQAVSICAEVKDLPGNRASKTCLVYLR
jgi:hypothetical protein